MTAENPDPPKTGPLAVRSVPSWPCNEAISHPSTVNPNEPTPITQTNKRPPLGPVPFAPEVAA